MQQPSAFAIASGAAPRRGAVKHSDTCKYRPAEACAGTRTRSVAARWRADLHSPSIAMDRRLPRANGGMWSEPPQVGTAAVAMMARTVGQQQHIRRPTSGTSAATAGRHANQARPSTPTRQNGAHPLGHAHAIRSGRAAVRGETPPLPLRGNRAQPLASNQAASRMGLRTGHVSPARRRPAPRLPPSPYRAERAAAAAAAGSPGSRSQPRQPAGLHRLGTEWSARRSEAGLPVTARPPRQNQLTSNLGKGAAVRRSGPLMAPVDPRIKAVPGARRGKPRHELLQPTTLTAARSSGVHAADADGWATTGRSAVGATSNRATVARKGHRVGGRRAASLQQLSARSARAARAVSPAAQGQQQQPPPRQLRYLGGSRPSSASPPTAAVIRRARVGPLTAAVSAAKAPSQQGLPDDGHRLSRSSPMASSRWESRARHDLPQLPSGRTPPTSTVIDRESRAGTRRMLTPPRAQHNGSRSRETGGTGDMSCHHPGPWDRQWPLANTVVGGEVSLDGTTQAKQASIQSREIRPSNAVMSTNTSARLSSQAFVTDDIFSTKTPEMTRYVEQPTLGTAVHAQEPRARRRNHAKSGTVATADESKSEENEEAPVVDWESAPDVGIATRCGGIY
jgi:hypothetical protein